MQRKARNFNAYDHRVWNTGRSLYCILWLAFITVSSWANMIGLQQQQQNDENQVNYLQISWPQVTDLIMSPTDPYLSWLNYCSDPESQWLNYALRTWTSSTLQFYIDFSPGIGRSFIPMAALSGKASLTFVKENGNMNQFLFYNLEQKGLHAKVLISSVPEITTSVDSTNVAHFYNSVRERLSLNCPDLVHLQYLYESQVMDMRLLMDNRWHIINECRSVLYMDSNATFILKAVSNYLYSLNYSLEYSELCNSCKDVNTPKNIRFVMYATPKESSQLVDNPPAFIPPAKYESLFGHFFRQSIKLNQPEECEETPDTVIVEPFHFTVPLSIITPSGSPLRCFPQVLYHDNMTDYHKLFFSEVEGMKYGNEVSLYVTWQCAAWVERIRQHFDYIIYHALRDKTQPSIRLSQCISLSSYRDRVASGVWSLLSLKDQRAKFLSIVDEELAKISENCQAFAYKQYLYLQNMRVSKLSGAPLYADKHLSVQYAHHQDISASDMTHTWFGIDGKSLSQPAAATAEQQQQQQEYSKNDVEVDLSDEYEAYEDIDLSISSVHRDNKKVNTENQQTRKRKSKLPFTMDWEPAVCDEPLHCRLTYEFQRRLFIWQNPDYAHLVQHYVFDPEYDNEDWHETEKVDDEEYVSFRTNPWPERNCANAKYFIYEPLSAHNGLGSMWEQIASMMRIAVCEDRIFVLNPGKDQAGTIRKWKMPGCQGNVWECYFQPLSMCPLSHAELEQAVDMPPATKLDDESVRRHRIVRYSGIPIQGTCAWCNSAWPVENSTFFRGLTTPEVTTLPYRQFEQYNYFRSFGSSFRHLSTMQFVRYLLRPRAWLQDLLPQIVLYSMVSPTSRDNPLVPVPFSPHFVSLHVRFGMKVAEELLVPLHRYMAIVQRKYPLVRDIFVSTETPRAIFNLTNSYPEFRFHHLHYIRNEYLFLQYSLPKDGSPSWNRPPIHSEDDLTGEIHEQLAEQCKTVTAFSDITADKPDNWTTEDFMDCVYLKSLQLYNHQQLQHAFLDEMLMSLANLYVATEAQGWVGTWTSNWCSVIAKLVRTRGDGGGEYHGVDRGSFYTRCF